MLVFFGNREDGLFYVIGNCFLLTKRRNLKWIRKNIILPQPLPTHQANHTLEILMKQFWRTVSPDSKDSRDKIGRAHV